MQRRSFTASDFSLAPSAATPNSTPVADRNVRKAESVVADPTQDALARQLQAMPGVSRW
jgi:hypothetical protein